MCLCVYSSVRLRVRRSVRLYICTSGCLHVCINPLKQTAIGPYIFPVRCSLYMCCPRMKSSGTCWRRIRMVQRQVRTLEKLEAARGKNRHGYTAQLTEKDWQSLPPKQCHTPPRDLFRLIQYIDCSIHGGTPQ